VGSSVNRARVCPPAPSRRMRRPTNWQKSGVRPSAGGLTSTSEASAPGRSRIVPNFKREAMTSRQVRGIAAQSSSVTTDADDRPVTTLRTRIPPEAENGALECAYVPRTRPVSAGQFPPGDATL